MNLFKFKFLYSCYLSSEYSSIYLFEMEQQSNKPSPLLNINLQMRIFSVNEELNIVEQAFENRPKPLPIILSDRYTHIYIIIYLSACTRECRSCSKKKSSSENMIK
jgi:hypothetical protein